MDHGVNSACDLVRAVHGGKISARRHIVETLKNCEEFNERAKLFTGVAVAEALDQASVVDEMLKKGKKPPLAGVPLAVKDDICWQGLPTGLGSRAMADFIPPYSATALERLVDAGAVVVGKTSLGDMGIEAAINLSNDHGVAVATSAGAATVAAGLCSLALESDSAGALRQGAATLGLFGLRPTAGLVSRFGLCSGVSSFSQIGITAVSTEDLQIALKVIAGFDPRDAATAAHADRKLSNNRRQSAVSEDPRETVIGYPLNVAPLLEKDMSEFFSRSRHTLIEKGFTVVDLDLPLLSEALRAYFVIALAETSSNFSRYDGIRFGTAADAQNLEDLYRKTRSLTFGAEARRRSIFGTYLLGKGNFDRYYRQALKVWSMVREEYDALFGRCRFLLLPALKRQFAPDCDEGDFLQAYENDLFCASVSLSARPALVFPAGKLNGLPIGLQLVGNACDEESLLRTGAKIATNVEYSPDGANRGRGNSDEL